MNPRFGCCWYNAVLRYYDEILQKHYSKFPICLGKTIENLGFMNSGHFLFILGTNEHFCTFMAKKVEQTGPLYLHCKFFSQFKHFSVQVSERHWQFLTLILYQRTEQLRFMKSVILASKFVDYLYSRHKFHGRGIELSDINLYLQYLDIKNSSTSLIYPNFWI